MVAKTPPCKERRMAAALNPYLVRETVKKVDRCMARLQELQYTVTGGNKVISGVSLSPRSTRGYLRTSLRCKQESLRLKNGSGGRKSPVGKFPGSTDGEWRRMSLPAMLLGETVVEILQASQFTKEIVTAASKLATAKAVINDPKTPDTTRRSKNIHCENTELRARRMREKKTQSRAAQLELSSSPLPRARSRISFKSNSPLTRKENRNNATKPVVSAHRVSPKNRPWAKKTVLFPNPVFLTSTSSPSTSHQKKFYKTRSPIIARTSQHHTPHKFRIKSPSSSLNSQFKNSKAVPKTSIVLSPTEKKVVATKVRRCSFSPSKLANRFISPTKLGNRFVSPSKLANRLVSPLKSRISLQKSGGGLIGGLKERPYFGTPVRMSSTRKV